jgi:very-short-patch-repair endonuclease
MRNHRKELRKNSTPEEIKLWKYLRKKRLGYLFYRQHSIGPYVVDFYSPAKRLVIELDGEQHKLNKDYDVQRDEYLKYLNHTILRFWNYEINSNIYHVLPTIRKNLENNPTP